MVVVLCRKFGSGIVSSAVFCEKWFTNNILGIISLDDSTHVTSYGRGKE